MLEILLPIASLSAVIGIGYALNKSVKKGLHDVENSVTKLHKEVSQSCKRLEDYADYTLGTLADVDYLIRDTHQYQRKIAHQIDNLHRECFEKPIIALVTPEEESPDEDPHEEPPHPFDSIYSDLEHPHNVPIEEEYSTPTIQAFESRIAELRANQNEYGLYEIPHEFMDDEIKRQREERPEVAW